MAGLVVPVAKALYVCDYHIGSSKGKVDLMGIFNAIRPKSYPHTHRPFACFAQLLGGLGHVQFHIDIRRAGDRRLIDWTGSRTLHFPNRTTMLQVVVTIPRCAFDAPGVYLVELYCDNVWVADTTIQLL